MRLATLRDGTRDGALIVVGRDGGSYARAAAIAPTLQAALDDWDRAAPALAALATKLDGWRPGEPARDPARLGPPLPRAYEWIDGSAFLEHVRRVRAARGASPPATLETDPLVYQGGSGVLLGPRDDIPLGDPAWGLDFESEVAVDPGRHAPGNARRGRARARAPRDAGQRHHAARTGRRRAGQGVRVLPVEAGDRVLAVRGHARRAGGGVARRARPSAGAHDATTARWRAIRTRARCTSLSSI